MLNASFGVQRVIRRVRRTTSRRTELAIQAQASAAAQRLRGRVHGAAGTARRLPMAHRLADVVDAAGAPDVADNPRRHTSSVVRRLGHERVCGLAVITILLGATALSNLPPTTASAAGGVGGTQGVGSAARIVVGGAFGVDRTGVVYQEPSDEEAAPPSAAFRPVAIAPDPELASGAPAEVTGPFLEDGTLLKPTAVQTTVADASDMLRTHRVKSGDTLVGIARQYGVSIHTIWWANNLKTKALKVGTKLTIPPVNGLVVTVGATDTLDSLATKYEVETDAILRANELSDPNLVVGQVLVMPGARGEPIPTPKPPKKAPAVKSNPSNPPKRSTPKGPTRYTGGRFVWPVTGGYVSQFYHYGHYAIDIAADAGTRVRSAAGGRVIFAGWKSNGGGYQVWISHGSGLYTTYNHMSSVSVGTGQSVGRGQQVGRVGSTGFASGPHLHFEVWRGKIWDGGRRVNPMGYL